jgi:hypothetical protein
VFGVENLFLSDRRVLPTPASANPALTIMALAARLAGPSLSRASDPSAASVDVGRGNGGAQRGDGVNVAWARRREEVCAQRVARMIRGSPFRLWRKWFS